MGALQTPSEPWAKRLTIPNYPVGEAARYAQIKPATIRSWQKLRGAHAGAVGARDSGTPLSYLQLIEVAVVAACRKAGMSLKRIREAREFVGKQFGTDYPFAQYRFATDGKKLLLHHGSGPTGDVWLGANEGGQLAWDRIIGPSLKAFEYEYELAIRWHVAGHGSPVVIDPRVAFGAPNLHGLPTWLFKDRWQAGEPIQETASDLGIKVSDVRKALQFEGVDLSRPQPTALH